MQPPSLWGFLVGLACSSQSAIRPGPVCVNLGFKSWRYVHLIRCWLGWPVWMDDRCLRWLTGNLTQARRETTGCKPVALRHWENEGCQLFLSPTTHGNYPRADCQFSNGGGGGGGWGPPQGHLAWLLWNRPRVASCWLKCRSDFGKLCFCHCFAF